MQSSTLGRRIRTVILWGQGHRRTCAAKMYNKLSNGWHPHFYMDDEHRHPSIMLCSMPKFKIFILLAWIPYPCEAMNLIFFTYHTSFTVTINFQVSAGHYHSVLLRSDGLVVTCGDNSYGQCEIPPPEAGKHYVCHGCHGHNFVQKNGHGYQL